MIEGAPKFVGAEEASSASSVPSLPTDAPAKNILEQRPLLSPAQSPVTLLQSQVDQLIGGFIAQATHWKSLCAMTAGGLAYRVGKLGTLSSRIGAIHDLPLRCASIGLGLTAEVSAFELTHRSLQSVTLTPTLSHQGRGGNQGIPSPLVGEVQGEGGLARNLWKWNGPLGLKNGFFTSLATFGALKGAGTLARGQNVVLQHFLQDTAMVFGHQAAGRIGWTPLPSESLAEQFLQAEATNLQIGAGLALGHAATGGRLFAVERGMDLLVRSFPDTDPRAHERANAQTNPFFEPAFAAEGKSRIPSDLVPEKPISLPISAMSGRRGSKPRLLVSPLLDTRVDARAKALAPSSGLGGKLSEAKAAVLRENFLDKRFPDAARSHSDEVIDALLTIPEYTVEFHERLLEAFALASNPGTVEQLYTAKAVEHLFKCDSLNTNTGSFENARLQFLIAKSLAEEAPILRLRNTKMIFEAMERNINPLKIDGLFERLEMNRGLSVNAATEDLPLSLRAHGQFQVHPIGKGEAQIYVDPRGRWGIQNFSENSFVWVVDRGEVKELKPHEHAPLPLGAEFMVGKKFETALGYVLRQSDEGPPSLRAGPTNLQILYAAAGKTVEKRTQALYAYESAYRSELYRPADVEAAFEFARNHPQGKLALTRLLHVLYAKDVPAKIRELRWETNEDTLEVIFSLHRQGRSPQEIAQEIDGTHHTAYMEDPRLARKLVSVLLDVGPYILNPALIRENDKQLQKAFMALLAAQEVMEGEGVKGETLAERIGVDELKEIIHSVGDPHVEAFLSDWAGGGFKLRLTKGETILKLIERMPEKDSAPGTALFIPAEPDKKDLLVEAGGSTVRIDRKMDLLLIKDLPDLPLETEADLQSALREVKDQFVRWIHEGDHQRSSSGRYHGIEAGGERIDYGRLNKIDRSTRLVSEMMGNLEDNRLIFKYMGTDYWEVSQRLGQNLAFFWRNENDYLYFDGLNRKLSEGKDRP